MKLVNDEKIVWNFTGILGQYADVMLFKLSYAILNRRSVDEI